MEFKVVTPIMALALLGAATNVLSQSLIVTVTLGPNQIGQVKTSQGITTRIIFPEPVKEIICGDLYDPTTGKGTFVVQRIDNDVFLKPVVANGLSNVFVKTGDKGEHTYAFDLQVVPLEQGHRVVNVASAIVSGGSEGQSAVNASEEAKKILTAAQQQADETARNAREQADRIMAQANLQATGIYTKALQRAEELDRKSAELAAQRVEERFVRAMIQGVKELKSADSHVAVKRIDLTLDPRVLTFDDKSYLRYSVKNNGDKEFRFSSLSLERRAGKETFVIPAKVIQGRAENKLEPGETIMGIIVFDPKEVRAEDKLTLYVRGEDNVEIARLNIQ